MNLSLCILTCTRPQPTLHRTVASLRAAGWDFPWVYDGSPAGKPTPHGCTAGGAAILRRALNRLDPACDGLMIVEDDVVFCRGAAEYLAAEPWPEPPDRIAVLSPYCAAAYSSVPPQVRRWHRECRGLYLAASQAWIYPVVQLPRILAHLESLLAAGEAYGIDRVMGMFAEAQGLDVWIHTPSLAQHIGINNSAIGYGDGEIFHAADFPGEEFDARSLAP